MPECNNAINKENTKRNELENFWKNYENGTTSSHIFQQRNVPVVDKTDDKNEKVNLEHNFWNDSK